jgi:hypothetical protein
MVADGMLTRKRYREVPPRVDYELTGRARDLMPILAELARWGYEWAWSSPRSSESIDVGAIFRLAPGLIRETEMTGTVELSVTGEDLDDAPPAYTVELADSGATVHECPADHADARISGALGAWIGAFSPEHDRTGLQVTGDTELAAAVLNGLALRGQTAASASQAVA